MKAAVLTAPRTMKIRDIPEPEISEFQVLLSPEYAGICGTDQHIFNGEFEGRVTYPAVLGHEFGGIIKEKGAKVTHFEEGERVVIDPILPCRACRACHEGKLSSCSFLRLRGVDSDGGMAERAVADENQLFRYPESLNPEYSPMAELYSIACHAASRGQIKPADTAVVFGAGKVGLSLIDVLSGLGVSSLVSVDPVAGRLIKASTLGADVTINPLKENPEDIIMDLTGGVGADIVFEAVGHYIETPGVPPPVAAAGGIVRNGGRIVVLGQGPQETPVFFKPLVWKEIEIVMSRVSRGEFPRAIALMEKGVLHPEHIITGIHPLEKAGEVFPALEEDPALHIKELLRIS